MQNKQCIIKLLINNKLDKKGKNIMKKSRVCALGLACFLGAVTAFSALAATSGGGAFTQFKR